MTTYRIQRGTLSGAFKTVYQTRALKAAWRAYFETRITAGEKKRIQERMGEDGKHRTIKDNKEFWT